MTSDGKRKPAKADRVAGAGRRRRGLLPGVWLLGRTTTADATVSPGFGLGVGNWLSLAICAVIPLVGLLPRIALEEAELARVLGDPYCSYQKARRRLVPGLW
jgi:protein-S-isoprenylcysteine O-methyltransferase Ste14